MSRPNLSELAKALGPVHVTVAQKGHLCQCRSVSVAKELRRCQCEYENSFLFTMITSSVVDAACSAPPKHATTIITIGPTSFPIAGYAGCHPKLVENLTDSKDWTFFLQPNLDPPLASLRSRIHTSSLFQSHSLIRSLFS